MKILKIEPSPVKKSASKLKFIYPKRAHQNTLILTATLPNDLGIHSIEPRAKLEGNK